VYPLARNVLIALGGNAIKQPHEKGTYEEQMANVETACQQIAGIARMGYGIVLTHGNGPQVGNLAIQQEQGAHMVPPQPLFVLGSMTQGQIGFMIQQSLQNQLQGDGRLVATVVTQVLVSLDDPDFQDPSKPVGPYYDEETAKRLARENGWLVKKVRPNGERPWRRVVPSPRPLGIVEAPVIKDLAKKGVVIDKDRAGAKLAQEVEADTLLILTDVEHAFLNFGTPKEEPLGSLGVEEAKQYLKEGHFKAGSMGPKVEASIGFVEAGGESAIITSLDKASEALEGKTGTHIHR